MAAKCLLLICVATLLSHASAEQLVLSGEKPRHGVLRRYSIESAVQRVLIAAAEHDLDVWHATDSYVDIYSPPDSLTLPTELRDLPHTTTPISSETPTPRKLQTAWDSISLENTTFHDTYHPLYEIESFMRQLNSTHANFRLANLGHTAEGREMLGLTISNGPYEEEEGKKKKKKKKGKKKTPVGRDGEKLGFVILGAQHAREWIASATSLYIAHALVANASESHSISYLLEHFDFHILPVPNPDGYDYTWETDRYWYKNRQVLGPYVKCVGLDMNRNWGYKWKPESIGMIHASDNATKPRLPIDPCSHWYPGSRAFESPEVNNIENWISTLPNVVGFVDLRSYGQMLSSPYSYTCKKLPKDAEDQIEAALGASHALTSVHGTDFQTGSLCSMLYAAPGNVVDWMYARRAIKYSYVAHLRDTGTYGFSLPEKWIAPTGEETTSLVNYLAKFIATQAKRKFST
ncbi:peptidase M14 [Crassisporium funariophilum]|nr:peptidase M14 [Crassisporium funariophilum]